MSRNAQELTLDLSEYTLGEIVSGLLFFIGAHTFFEDEFYEFFLEAPQTESWRKRFGSDQPRRASINACLIMNRVRNQVLVTGNSLYCPNLLMNAARQSELEAAGIFPKFGGLFSKLAGSFIAFTAERRKRIRK